MVKKALLQVSNYGRLKNAVGFKYFPKPEATGYCRLLMMKSHLGVHRLVHFLFHDPDLRSFVPGSTVDHINRNRGDNRASNLRYATRVEQRKNQKKKDVASYDDRRISVHIEKGGKQHTFPSLSSAAKFIGVVTSRLSEQKAIVHGWKIHRLQDDDLPGEQWGHLVNKTFVSQLGRIMQSGVKRYPTAQPDGYSRVAGKGTAMAHAVLIAFGFPRPSEKHSADHIDRNRSNNALSNLRWVLADVQVENRSSSNERQVRRVEARKVGSVGWTLYATLKQACSELGVNPSTVKNVMNPKHALSSTPVSSKEQYEFRWEIQDDLDGEEWKTVQPTEWCIPGGKYFDIATTFQSQKEKTSIPMLKRPRVNDSSDEASLSDDSDDE